MDEIDKLLSQIKADYQETPKTPKQPKNSPTQPTTDINNLLTEVKGNYSNRQLTSKSSTNNPSAIDSILSQVKANYDAQDKARSPLALHSVQSQLEQQQLETEKLKQIETLKLRAKDWLKQLDPLSTEGLWFERFAEGYPTKLEAAINYLQEF
jgi:hypothetical protein